MTKTNNDLKHVSLMLAERDAIVKKAMLAGSTAAEVVALLDEFDREMSKRLQEESAKRKGGGRPPIPQQLRRTHRYTINLNEEEVTLIMSLGSEKDVQVLLRELALEAAKRRLKNENKQEN